MTQRFTTSQWIPFPVEQVFAFFANPANLPRLMPAAMQTRLEQARLQPAPARPAGAHGFMQTAGVAAGAGSEMEISFRPLPWIPFRVRWTARIAEFEWNSHFCDEQVRGPFAKFRHCHRICAENRDGVDGSMVADAIEFEMPFGFLGAPAGLFARLNLAKSFAQRQQSLPQLLYQDNQAPSGSSSASMPAQSIG